MNLSRRRIFSVHTLFNLRRGEGSGCVCGGGGGVASPVDGAFVNSQGSACKEKFARQVKQIVAFGLGCCV